MEKECVEFLKTLRYTQGDFKKLKSYEIEFIISRADEECITGMEKTLTELIEGKLILGKTKRNYSSVRRKLVRANVDSRMEE